MTACPYILTDGVAFASHGGAGRNRGTPTGYRPAPKDPPAAKGSRKDKKEKVKAGKKKTRSGHLYEIFWILNEKCRVYHSRVYHFNFAKFNRYSEVVDGTGTKASLRCCLSRKIGAACTSRRLGSRLWASLLARRTAVHGSGRATARNEAVRLLALSTQELHYMYNEAVRLLALSTSATSLQTRQAVGAAWHGCVHLCSFEADAIYLVSGQCSDSPSIDDIL